MRWSDFRGAQVTGSAMDYKLTLLGTATNVTTGKTSAALTFPQVCFVDPLQGIADVLNQFALHPELRDGLEQWGRAMSLSSHRVNNQHAGRSRE
jgi:hypothetical protein